MKVLILPDGRNWVVDRNCKALVGALPEIEFTIRGYSYNNEAFGIRQIKTEELEEISKDFDLIHMFNWDVGWLKGLSRLETPLLITVRSHRYRPAVLDFLNRPNTWFHVINEDLLNDFPGATYIPNGIFEHFKPRRKFTVGYAGHPHEIAKQYDGYYLIQQACKELNVKFNPALKIDPRDMPRYYRSLDLYVCASEAEGFSTGTMECLAMNIPAISVDSGVARHHVPFIIERTVEGIKEGILKFYTQPLVEKYRWSKLAPQYKSLYEKILNT